jgi:tungstate transport system permease protein
MTDFASAFGLAFELIAGADPALWSIVWLSIQVSLASTFFACVLGLPFGAWIGVARFRGRRMAIVFLNAALGIPTVVVGLVVYLLLSRAGPLGELGILFTPAAIVVAETLLVLPIVAALAREVVEAGWQEYREQLTSLGVRLGRAVRTLIWDLRFPLLTVVLAGFGRAISEVGAVMIVGGNIDGVTRVMTTAIALETSKGDLPLALGLGVVLLLVVLVVNLAADALRGWSARHHG